jgi:RNA polymerase sigma factor (sigma-70 family)
MVCERVPKATAGAEVDFASFFAMSLPRVISIVNRLCGDTATAEDAAVEALARAYLIWDRLSLVNYRDAWVLRVALNFAYDQLRRDRRARRTWRVAPAQDPTESVVLHMALIKALRSLSRRQREVLVLHHLAGCSYEEIASLLGCSVGTAKVHGHRGIARLRSDAALHVFRESEDEHDVS